MRRLPDRTVTRPDARGASHDSDAQPWLFLVSCGQQPEVTPARHGLGGFARVAIGRGEPSEAPALEESGALALRVPDPWMSSAHVTLERVVGSWIVTDAGSKNGTMVNGALTRRARLDDGDLVEAGSTVFVFRAALAPSNAPAPTSDPPAMATLLPALAVEFERLRGIAPTRVPVLLRGEAGIGKAALAATIHALSGRPGAFVSLPGGALAPAAVPAEVARARQGTLALDEVGELSGPAQTALLDALGGGPRNAAVDLRVVGLTRHDPDALVAAGTLRPELLALLSGFGLTLPPLRERRADLGLLLRSTLARVGAVGVHIDPAALRALLAYGWPNNRPEFERCVEEALARSRPGDTVTVDHLPVGVRVTPAPAVHAPSASIPAPALSEGPPLFANEGDSWAITWDAAVARLRDGDGVRYLAYLIERPGVEVHAMELTSFARALRVSDAPPAGPQPRMADEGGDALGSWNGDAGPLVDAQAREAYRSRIESLREVVEEAAGWGDRERAAKAQAELDALARELARAVGLGGRERKAGSAAERSRVTVTMRIRGTLKKLAEVHALLAEHLEATVHTGTFCVYTPRPTRKT